MQDPTSEVCICCRGLRTSLEPCCKTQTILTYTTARRRIFFINQQLTLIVASYTAALSIGCLFGAPAATARNAETVSLPTEAKDIPVSIPDILSVSDAQIYRQIFAFQRKGNWQRTDKLVRRLNNRILMGHVQAQRYLHPTKYRSRYSELSQWLKSYADHPDARRIYKLALKRRPHNYRRHPVRR